MNPTRNVRRLGATLAAALSAGVLVAAPAVGAEGGPPCSDFTDGVVSWNGTTVDVDAVLAAPACARLTYRVYATLTDPDGAEPAVWTQISDYTASGDGIAFAPLALADPTPEVGCDHFAYVYVTSATARGHVFDRAPDAGYIQVAIPTDRTSDGDICGSPGQVFH